MAVKYIPGTTNTVADCLSRVPTEANTIQLPILQIHQITNNLRCTADWLQKLHEKTAQDDIWLFLSMLFIQGGLRKFKSCQQNSTHIGHSMRH